LLRIRCSDVLAETIFYSTTKSTKYTELGDPQIPQIPQISADSDFRIRKEGIEEMGGGV
jgi:hypothetical protein